jgi:hypothetical protein
MADDLFVTADGINPEGFAHIAVDIDPSMHERSSRGSVF